MEMVCFVIYHAVEARMLDPGLTGCVTMHVTTSPQMPIGEKITFIMCKAETFLMCESVSSNNVETLCRHTRGAATVVV